MYAHLKTGAPLPGIPGGAHHAAKLAAGNSPAISASNVPPIATSPAAGDVIEKHASDTVSVPV